MVPDLIAAADVPASHVGGIGLSVPGPVDRETGRVMEPLTMSGLLGLATRG
ncbi:hypothetical protein [Streptomyces flaveolus]|uniref:hypothetical protein n=1 Tax=Streptomyces flaveolus TaxID=67297 RepID=UPI0034DBC56E